jgi:hypothetical protein
MTLKSLLDNFAKSSRRLFYVIEKTFLTFMKTKKPHLQNPVFRKTHVVYTVFDIIKYQILLFSARIEIITQL